MSFTKSVEVDGDMIGTACELASFSSWDGSSTSRCPDARGAASCSTRQGASSISVTSEFVERDAVVEPRDSRSRFADGAGLAETRDRFAWTDGRIRRNFSRLG